MSYCRPPVFSLQDQARLQSSLRQSGTGFEPAETADSRQSFRSFMASTHATLRSSPVSDLLPRAGSPSERTGQISPAPTSLPAPGLETEPNLSSLVKSEEGEDRQQPEPPAAPPRLGSLSSRFESGHAPDAIGYDPVGGTSYGLYQISSRAGSMDRFLDFLDTAAPDTAARLRSAGPADTGNRHGAMPEMWKTIASTDPQEFQALQHEFIAETHYRPLVRAVQRSTGLDLESASVAVREVAWSTAIQHGPENGAAIMSRAVESARRNPESEFEATLIANTYAERGTRFGSSPLPIQETVRARFDSEQSLALAMLGRETARA